MKYLRSLFRNLRLMLYTAIALVYMTAPAIASSKNPTIIEQLLSPWYAMNEGTSSCGGDANLEGSVVAEKVINFFVGKGYEPYQAAAIAGNMKHESGLQPQRLQGSNSGTVTPAESLSSAQLNNGNLGWGIVQWTPPKKIIEGANPPSKANELEFQLTFLLDQLEGKGAYSEKQAGDELKATKDVENATVAFQGTEPGQTVTYKGKVYGPYRGYERPGDKQATIDERINTARSFLAKYGSGAGSGDSGSCTESSINLDPNFKMTKLSPPLATPGGKIDPKGITLHWWGGNSGGRGINSLADTLRSRGLSVQIGITAEGKIYQMTNDLLDYTSHATGGNTTTFGIEIEGVPEDFGKAGATKYPEKFNAVVATVKYLVSKYNIPLDGPPTCGDVVGVHPHKAYNSCPGAEAKSDVDDEYFNAVMKAVRGQ